MTRTVGRFRIKATKAQLEEQMKRRETQRAAMRQCERFFAAVDVNGMVDARTLSREARHARRLTARSWLLAENQTEAEGYARAFKRGYRVKPVYVVPQSVWLPIVRDE